MPDDFGSGNTSLHQKDFTVEVFVKVSSIYTYRSFVTRGTGQVDDGWSLKCQPGTSGDYAAATLQNGTFWDSNETTPLGDDQWHHLALVVHTSVPGEEYAALYVDYVLEATKTSGMDTWDYNIVKPMDFGSNRHTGFADEVRFSDTVLAANEFLRAVPEPASLSLVAAGALAVLRRRKRR